jgi:eukaryotic-like serine/threonine-protein kinase
VTAQDGSLVGQTLGVYRLRSLLGVGGMAEVYLAEDPSLRRDIAVKVLPRSLAADPGYVERFRNEAQRVASLSHPHITPVYTFGEERGLLYLVMPRMKESLRERMDREGQLALQEAARMTNQIAAALYIAHQHGIVHRDVKPENILLDESGKAMLTDFGIARELSALREAGVARTLAATGLPVGTPEYMAPEQLRGLPATEQVDLYALGVVLYEMLTGHVPHDATTPYEVATAVLRDPVRPPSYYNARLSAEVEQVIVTAMAKDPTRRYHDMKAFAMALRGALNGQSKPVNSGALHWTQYAPPQAAASVAGAAGVAGVAGVASGPSLGKSLASASSSLIRPPQIGLTDTTKRQTVGQSSLALMGEYAGEYAGSASAPLPRRISRRSAILLGAVALVLLVALVATGMSVSSALGLFTNSVGSPTLVARRTPTATVTAVATTAPTATATIAPTTTPIYVYVQPTATPPKPLSISPTTVVLNGGKTTCQTSFSSPIMISNLDSSVVTWKWTSSQPSLTGMSFRWDLNNTGWHTSGLPYDSKGIAAYDGTTAHSDSLALQISCNSLKNAAPITVTMTDSQGRSYTLKLTT